MKLMNTEEYSEIGSALSKRHFFFLNMALSVGTMLTLLNHSNLVLLKHQTQ